MASTGKSDAKANTGDLSAASRRVSFGATTTEEAPRGGVSCGGRGDSLIDGASTKQILLQAFKRPLRLGELPTLMREPIFRHRRRRRRRKLLDCRFGLRSVGTR